MDKFEQILAEHPFFKEMEEHHLDLIIGCASNVRFNEGEMIFREEEEANEFYVIREGKVALDLHSPNSGIITIDTLEDGEILGWSWLVPPYYWRFDARATQNTRAIALDGKCLRDKCESDHNLGYELLKRFTSIIEQRLQATRLQLLDIYGV